MIRNLLPRDARCIELASSFGMLLLSASLALDMSITAYMHALHPPQFWALLLACLGGLQLVALLTYPRLDALRVGVAFVSGLWWAWLAMAGVDAALYPSDFAALMMGLGNLYAFTLGALTMRRTWT